MKWGVIQFPGSNCDQDSYHVLKNVLDQYVDYVWHKAAFDISKKYDAIMLPGGFSYGDYLRTGAMARFSPMMKCVIDFANAGGLVLGSCNGFQILVESGLLPGAFLKNKNLTFICDTVELSVENKTTPFTQKYNKAEKIWLPIAHGDGNYYIDEMGLEKLRKNNQIVLRYSDNPNGSVDNIAGICNEKRNVLGLMPHPERRSERILGGEDGLRMFQSAIEFLEKRH